MIWMQTFFVFSGCSHWKSQGHLRRDPATESEGISGICHALVWDLGNPVFGSKIATKHGKHVRNLKSHLEPRA